MHLMSKKRQATPRFIFANNYQGIFLADRPTLRKIDPTVSPCKLRGELLSIGSEVALFQFF